MKTLIRTLAAIAALAYLFPPNASAALREVKPGVYVDDLKAASPNPLQELDKQDIYELAVNPAERKRETSQPKAFKIGRDGNKPAMYLKGGFHTRLYYQGKNFKDFVLETEVKKTRGSYAGVVVRDHWRVYFQMRGFLCLNTSMKGMPTGMLIKSDKTYRGYHKLKVICAGPQLHVYVDDVFIFGSKVPDKPGKVGIYSHGGGEAYYRNLRVDTHVPPSAYFAIDPKAPDDSLVFSPDEPIKLTFEIRNSSKTRPAVTLAASVKSWDGKKTLRETVRRTVKTKPGSTLAVLDMGRIPAGFHCVAYKASIAGKPLTSIDDLPLAVQERGDGNFKPPVIPVSAYSKYFNKTQPIYHNTYMHAVARSLKDHGFNSIVADPFFNKKAIDIYQSYGIATIARSGRDLAHPAVIATLAGDEPKPDDIARLRESYDALQKTSGKFVTTCLVGEGAGLGGSHGPVAIWRKLGARLRAFRWYGVKKSHYDLLYHLKYKGILPLSDIMTVVELSSDTPWWFVPPSFGSTMHEGYYKNPTPAQMKGLMHIAMAHGADGLMLWCLQSWGRWPALIAQKSLIPPDGKYEAAAEVARLINKHAGLLKSLTHGGFEVRNSNPVYIDAVPRKTRAGRAYIYAFNRDANKPASATLAFKGRGGSSVRDLYAGKTLKAAPAADGLSAVTVNLGPCDAALLQVDAVVPAHREIRPPTGASGLDRGLTAKVRAQVRKTGVAVMTARMPATPCIPGDAIGLSRVDDPRTMWKAKKPNPLCLSWSGLVHERTAEGYLSLQAALRLVDAIGAAKIPRKPKKGKPDPNAKIVPATPFWVVYPAAGKTKPTPAQFRAMLHLALAHRAKAVVAPDSIGRSLAAVVSEVARIASRHGKTIAALVHGGLDVRCKNAMVSAVPVKNAADTRYVYAVNLDTKNAVTADILLFSQVWNWAKARDVFAGRNLTVKKPDKEGYLACTVTLKPGEGKLIETDAKQKPKRRPKRKPKPKPKKKPKKKPKRR